MNKYIIYILMLLLLLISVKAQDSSNISKNKFHLVSLNNYYTYFRIPYGGFFKNDELFNLQGLGKELSYSSNFKKRPHVYYGVSVGYERYKMIFYNMDYDMNHYYDKEWNKTQHHLGEKLNYYVYNPYFIQSGRNSHIDDSLLMYFGKRNYYFDYLNIKYEIGYTARFGKKLMFRVGLQSSGFSPLNKSLTRYDIGYIQLYPSIEPWFLPFITIAYPFFYVYYSIKEKHFLRWGFLSSVFYVNYNLYKNHYLGFMLSITNVSIIKELSYYDPVYKKNPHCLGCINEDGPLGHFGLSINPHDYNRINAGIIYSIRLNK